MEIKDRIMQGAFDLFMQYGIKSVTMDEIAVHLSVSKKTIYQHFKDKDELVFLVTNNHFNEEEMEMEKITKNSKDPIDEMMGIWRYLHTILVNMNLSVVFDMKKYHPKAYQGFVDFQSRCVFQTVSRNLQEGVKQGFYRENIDIPILTRLKLIEIEAGFNVSVFPVAEFKPVDVQAQLFHHYLYGILTQKGIELYKQYESQI